MLVSCGRARVEIGMVVVRKGKGEVREDLGWLQ
jgi:hypothetical protein